ncbi:hypothetical protein FRC10_007930, partial [Ceratobasidium sp. 414]
QKAQQLSKDGARVQRLRESASERQGRCRQQLKEAEIKLGLRNPGTLWLIKPMQLRNPLPDPLVPTSHADPEPVKEA